MALTNYLPNKATIAALTVAAAANVRQAAAQVAAAQDDDSATPPAIDWSNPATQYIAAGTGAVLVLTITACCLKDQISNCASNASNALARFWYGTPSHDALQEGLMQGHKEAATKKSAAV